MTYPTYSDSSFVSDIDSIIGVWHYPNYKYRHRQSCFDVEYNTNSYGAKDKERTLKSEGKRRFIVLGDSFVDGYGVNDSERVTNLLENKSGYEFLNFGGGGSFGTIQEMLLYQSKAIKFEHTDVLLFLSPDTDFLDNRDNSSPKDRYVPYLKSVSDTFQLYFTVKFSERNNNYFKRELTTYESYINIVSNYSKLFNLIRNSSRSIYFNQLRDNTANHSFNKVAYNKPFYTDEDIKKFYYCINKIKETGKDKKIYIIIIPTRKVYEYYEKNGYNFDLVKDLNEMNQINGVEVIDILYLSKNQTNYENMFLNCDEHWSKNGNKVVAELLYNNLFKLNE